MIALTLEELLMKRDLKNETTGESCTECQHNIAHYTFEGVERHDHVACAFCCESSKFIKVKSK